MALIDDGPILITGKNGQLSQALQSYLHSEQIVYVAYGREEMDIRCKHSVRSVFSRWKPSVIIHTAAMTEVDRGEKDFYEMMETNVHGTKNMLEVAEEYACPFLYMSSDFVFNGKKGAEYAEWDRPFPINQYGFSKWLGEEYVRQYQFPWWIVRTSWLYGFGDHHFVYKVAKGALHGEEMYVVTDQIGSPTYVKDLATALIQLLRKPSGVYHLANQGKCSKFQLAQFIYERLSEKNKVNAITSREWTSEAERPIYSPLVSRVGIDSSFNINRPWEEAVEAYLREKGWFYD